ncbi:hypothetical protein F0344_23555 [Streptomyces finlayi]|uniref:Secreted protein n=1 Tax=Streptomyces finlayi TaxID=67296 RepID=A0A7G7BVM9_9ACTN|nr:hypothetical protein F0344_23555 [Streptomyces finlayi]
MGRRRRPRGRRTLAHLLVLPLLASLALALGTPVQAVAACSGRPAKTVSFAKGELRVYKSRAYVCAVTVAKKPGTRRAMSVSLQARGGRPVVDEGRFTTRAGPVTVYALNRCVRATGAVAGTSGSTGWILC